MVSLSDKHLSGYKPKERIEIPPLYSWPPRPVAAVRWLMFDLHFPWGFFFIFLSVFSWKFLSPTHETLRSLNLSWMAMVWLRNAVLLSSVAGTIHWVLYIRRFQKNEYKFDERWLQKNSRKFLCRDQVIDNIFWSLFSGVTVWSLFETLTLWMWASGRISKVNWGSDTVYLSFMLVAFFLLSGVHFWLIHSLLHWRPLYKYVHRLHHRNVTPGPWSGISMHPVEHILYFSFFLVWWVLPVHPLLILLTGLYKGIEPTVSHSGFQKITIGKKLKIEAGDFFHQLHHGLFKVNYGNNIVPLDALFGNWHDGESDKSLKDE